MLCLPQLSSSAGAESLYEDYVKSILEIYNVFGTEDDLPDVGARQKGRGIRQGQIWLLPEVESGILIDNNVLATPGATRDDAAHYVRSNLKLKSNFGRHEVAAEGSVKHAEYFSRSSESRTEAYGKVQARIDIMRDLNAYLSLRGGTFNMERGEIVAPTFTRSLIEYQTVDIAGRLVKSFNRLKLSGGIRYTNFDYEDGVTFAGANFDQDFRDYDRIEVGGRASYAISLPHGAKFASAYRVFGDVRFTSHDTGGAAATNRSFVGWRVLGGLEFELGSLLRGDAGMGYNYVDYTSALFGASSSYSFILNLVWNPTPLMTFNLDAQQRFGESTLPGISGSDQTYARLGLDYEVLRRLIVSPSLRMVYDNFNDSSIEGYTLEAGVRAEYEINRYLNFGFKYNFTNRDFTGVALDFSRHEAGLYLKARF